MFVLVCSRFIVRQVFTFPACSHLCVYRLRHFSCRTGELVMIPVGFTDTIMTAIMFCSVSAVLSEQDSAAAQQYSRQGCPTGLRADVWALILNATNQPQVAAAALGVLCQLSRRQLWVFGAKQMWPTQLQWFPDSPSSSQFWSSESQLLCPVYLHHLGLLRRAQMLR